MNAWTDRETDRQNSHTSCIYGTHLGSPQLSFIFIAVVGKCWLKLMKDLGELRIRETV